MSEAGLPVHFFTIVLNGEPFIRYHADVFRRLPFRWHWHVVEGVACLVHDTAWSVASGGHVDPELHRDGLSIDGTTAYLDEIAALDSERISLYRKSGGAFWDGKREMVSAPLANIGEESLLWQVDADELWTPEQISAMRDLFLGEPERTAAYYWCDYVPAPGAVIATRYNYAQNPAQEWLRTWRFRPGDRWAAHEPPTLVRPGRTGDVDLGKARPFRHDETEDAGAVFQHFAYATEAQVRFKESYYGYDGAVERWCALQDALRGSRGPLRLGDYLPWVTDDTLVDDAERRRIRLLARERAAGHWTFELPGLGSVERDSRTAAIVVDGVFFQHGLNTGIARVWRSLLDEWLKSGFAERLVFLDRGGAGPRLEGLTTRSVPLWDRDRTAADSLRLQRVCDEEQASLFVSTYYTTPLATPSVMLVYDMIPERLGLDMSDVVWEEKHAAIEHASAYACISESTRHDLFDLAPAAAGKPAVVVLLGVDDHFFSANDADAAAFRRAFDVDRPYFVVVGDRRGVDGYKNVSLLFRALRDWPDAAAYEIVCVGGAEEVEPELVRLAPGVRARRFALTDDELRGAYRGAVALVFPSRYEGFGLPVAEAMAAGCPVITTPRSSLPEVGGDAVVYVDPDDGAALRGAFDEVLEPTRRAELIEAGRERAKAFTWTAAASALASELVAVAEADANEHEIERRLEWERRRTEQNREQLARAASRPPLDVSASAVTTLSVETRLKRLARRHLPLWSVELLRRARSRARAIRARTYISP